MMGLSPSFMSACGATCVPRCKSPISQLLSSFLCVLTRMTRGFGLWFTRGGKSQVLVSVVEPSPWVRVLIRGRRERPRAFFSG